MSAVMMVRFVIPMLAAFSSMYIFCVLEFDTEVKVDSGNAFACIAMTSHVSRIPVLANASAFSPRKLINCIIRKVYFKGVSIPEIFYSNLKTKSLDVF